MTASDELLDKLRSGPKQASELNPLNRQAVWVALTRLKTAKKVISSQGWYYSVEWMKRAKGTRDYPVGLAIRWVRQQELNFQKLLTYAPAEQTAALLGWLLTMRDNTIPQYLAELGYKETEESDNEF